MSDLILALLYVLGTYWPASVGQYDCPLTNNSANIKCVYYRRQSWQRFRIIHTIRLKLLDE